MGQQRGYYGNRRPPEPPATTEFSPERHERDAVAIIEEGDAERLVRLAEKAAKEGKATRTSVRRLFGEVRRIEFLMEQDQEAALRRARLLEPRVMYQKERAAELKPLAEILIALLRKASQQGDPKKGQEKFRRFAEFFEAVVAYLPEDNRGKRG